MQQKLPDRSTSSSSLNKVWFDTVFRQEIWIYPLKLLLFCDGLQTKEMAVKQLLFSK